MKHDVELFDLYFPAALHFVASVPGGATMPAQNVVKQAADLALAALDARETLVSGGTLAFEQAGPAQRQHVPPGQNAPPPQQYAQPPAAFTAGPPPGQPGVSTSSNYVPKPGEAVLESGRGYVITPGAPGAPPVAPGQ